MSDNKTLAGRDLAAFRKDPNFTGAFVGGPPLMSATQVRRILEEPQKVDREAAATLRKIRQKLQASEE